MLIALYIEDGDFEQSMHALDRRRSLSPSLPLSLSPSLPLSLSSSFSLLLPLHLSLVFL